MQIPRSRKVQPISKNRHGIYASHAPFLLSCHNVRSITSFPWRRLGIPYWSPNSAMIRLPPTGIAISQNELQIHLEDLDFHSTLLRRGFKKYEVIRYLRERDANNQVCPPTESASPGSGHAPSTYTLLSQSRKTQSWPSHSPDLTQHQLASSPLSAERSETSPDPKAASVSEPDLVIGKKTYAPRRSSLLRFAQRISSEPPEADKTVEGLFSPRSAIKYRPRSHTYSYDQSEMDDDDLVGGYATPVDELENLSLDDELVTSVDSTKTTVQIPSTLRPDAKPFTPSHVQYILKREATKNGDGSSTLASSDSSFPSSPPVVSQMSDRSLHSSPALPPLLHTPLLAYDHITPAGAQEGSQQLFLDGSFTVYNDSIPARFQPQTPAALSRNRYPNDTDAAYTAPPGMIRSGIARQTLDGNRQTSGELSPTAQASLIRQRRQREFVRGLQVEGLRIDRAHANARQPGADPGAMIDQLNIWRDDLDADGVGEENFEDASLTATLGRLRTVSGNRRMM